MNSVDRGFTGKFAGLFAVALLCLSSRVVAAQGYKQVNLVSDLPDVARRIDPNLVNGWGIVSTPFDRFWINDNGTGVSTIYTPKGEPVPLVVTIPPAAPTGIVFNPTPDIVVSSGGSSGPGLFIFPTEAGTI